MFGLNMAAGRINYIYIEERSTVVYFLFFFAVFFFFLSGLIIIADDVWVNSRKYSGMERREKETRQTKWPKCTSRILADVY